MNIALVLLASSLFLNSPGTNTKHKHPNTVKDPTAHGLMAGPHSPPLTRTRTIGLKPEQSV
ncbi:BnaAnng10760D [Brassica napus]|uniref:BnaAnng10760D protein n=1 Tax=Brassica napus TaxID=3708 RepID=A0A078IQT0_BRANA|nr:BnaAnng10760D [Brassica napus]